MTNEMAQTIDCGETIVPECCADTEIVELYNPEIPALNIPKAPKSIGTSFESVGFYRSSPAIWRTLDMRGIMVEQYFRSA
jgi:hypothetical protein